MPATVTSVSFFFLFSFNQHVHLIATQLGTKPVEYDRFMIKHSSHYTMMAAAKNISKLQSK
jgi:hypothetical protein